MRIVHFSDTYLPRRDGVITSLRTLVTAQREAGDEPLTVVPRHPDQAPEPGLRSLRAVPLGVARLRVSPWLLRGRSSAGTIAALAEYGAQLIHVHTPGPVGLLGVLAARRLGLPLVQTYHTDLHAYADAYRFPAPALRVGVRLYAHRLEVSRPPIRSEAGGPGRSPRRAAMDACNSLLLGRADAVVVPTRAVLDRVALPVSDDRIFVVPTGVAAQPADPEAVTRFRADCGLASSDRVVLFVGRINREKGVQLLVSAFARVVAADEQARLILVGAVYEPRWLTGLLRGAGADVAARVVVAGEQPGRVVAAAYACAQVFAFPSRTDTQALVLQEAALAGLPIVMVDPVLHRVGALGGRGVLADASPEPFATGIGGLLAAPDRARRIGADAAAQAARHTPAEYAAAMGSVYRYARAGVAVG